MAGSEPTDYTYQEGSGVQEEGLRAALRPSSWAAVWQIVPALGPKRPCRSWVATPACFHPEQSQGLPSPYLQGREAQAHYDRN